MSFNTQNELYTGYAHSIADINNDFVPDLIITTKSSDDSNKIQFQALIINPFSNQYETNDSYSYSVPDSSYLYGQSLFADFDSDGTFEHLLPACKDSQCTRSVLFIRKDSKVVFDSKIKFK